MNECRVKGDLEAGVFGKDGQAQQHILLKVVVFIHKRGVVAVQPQSQGIPKSSHPKHAITVGPYR